MNSILSKINFVIIILFIIGIFFASARTITHNNHIIKDNNQLSFFNHYTNIKNSHSTNKKNIQSKDLCEKIDNYLIDRHHLRWVFEKLRLSYLELFGKDVADQKKISYAYTLLLALLINASFFVSILTIKKNIYQFILYNKSNFFFFFLIFFFMIAFYSFRQLGGTRFTFFELFFLSTSLYAAVKKKKIIFLISVICATLNRESGILISSIWLIINGFNIQNKKLELSSKEIFFGSIVIILSILTLIGFNYKIFACGFNINLFTLSRQGTFHFHFFDTNIIRDANILFQNFFIIIFLLYVFYINFDRQFKLILIILLYNIIFLFFTPPDHFGLRITLAPIFVLYINEYFLINQKIQKRIIKMP